MISAARLAARVPVAPREFQAGFDGLRPAVAEERARQTRERGEALGEPPLQRVKEQIRRVEQRLRLIRDRAGQPGVRVSEGGDADPGQQVQICATVDIVEPDALAAHERHRRATVGLQHVPGFERLNVGACTASYRVPGSGDLVSWLSGHRLVD